MGTKFFSFLGNSRSFKAKKSMFDAQNGYHRSRRLTVESLEPRLLLATTGTGTEIDPFVVDTWADLQSCVEGPGTTAVYINLLNSIDLTQDDTQITVEREIIIDGGGSFITGLGEGSDVRAFYVTGDTSSLTLKNMTVGLFDSASNGGAVYIESGSLSCTSTVFGTFDENSEAGSNSAANGGAVYLESGSLSCTSTKFDSNIATGNGGAVYIAQGCTANFVDVCNFSYNEANKGGAISNYGTVSIDNTDPKTVSLFDGNSAYLFGGAYFGCGSFTGTYLNFTDNIAQTGGAIFSQTNTALYASGAYVSIAGEFCIGNVAETSSTGNGYGNGGVIANWGTAVLAFSIVGDSAPGSSNSASRNGGAFYNGTGGIMTITGGIFDHNSANGTWDGNVFIPNGEGTGHGGAISNFGTLTLDGSTSFSCNGASNNGGAIASSGTIIFNSDARFYDNSANEFGGAIVNTGTVIFGTDAQLTFVSNDKGNNLSTSFTDAGGNDYYKGTDIADGSGNNYFYENGEVKSSIIHLRNIPDQTVTPPVNTQRDCVYSYRWTGLPVQSASLTPLVNEPTAPEPIYPVMAESVSTVLTTENLTTETEFAVAEVSLPLTALTVTDTVAVPVAFIPVATTINVVAPDAIALDDKKTARVILFDSFIVEEAVLDENLDFVTPETTQNYDDSDEDEAFLDLDFGVL